MQGAGIQIQVLRFTLLIVLTIALASVAFRINSQSSPSASRHPGASPLPSTGAGSPSSGPQSPSVQPTHATRAPRTAGQGQGQGGAGSASAGGGSAQELPVTGWDPALKLGAFAFVLIGGGVLTVRAAGPRRPRQRLTVQD